VVFNLREESTLFMMAAPITARVASAIELLREHGHPNYAPCFQEVERVDVLGEHRIPVLCSAGR